MVHVKSWKKKKKKKNRERVYSVLINNLSNSYIL